MVATTELPGYDERDQARIVPDLSVERLMHSHGTSFLPADQYLVWFGAERSVSSLSIGIDRLMHVVPYGMSWCRLMDSMA